ncbi:tol-pal system protein YbgF [bacterium]|nr:tol-pal system protein YbgF [bacterium]
MMAVCGKSSLAAILVLAVLAVAGCGGAKSSDLQILRSEVFGLRQDQRQLKSQIALLDSLVNQRVETLDRFQAGYRSDTGQLEEQMSTLQQRISDTEQRLLRLQSEFQARAVSGQSVPAAGGSATATPATQNAADPNQLYELAYKDFTASNYQMAIEGFRDFLARYPDIPLAANANLYIGNSFRALKKYDEAIKAYRQIVDRFPDSQLVPDALYRIGDCYISMGQKARGETFLQTVVQKYPDSDAAQMARARLNP